MSDFPEFPKAQRRDNKAVEATQHSQHKGIDSFMSKAKKLSSDQLLEALEASGKDATWYAEALGKIIRGESPTLRMRGLQLIAKIVAQKEGVKLLTGELQDMTQEELQAAYDQVQLEMQEKRESPRPN